VAEGHSGGLVHGIVTLENHLPFSPKVEDSTTYDPSIALLDVYPEHEGESVSKDRDKVLVAAVVTEFPDWKIT
jgi:hypothetical protein